MRVEPLDMGEVDQMRRAGEPLLHHRHQRVAAGDQLGVLVLDQEIGGLPHGRRTMIFEFVHEDFLIALRDDVSYARSEFAIALAPAAIDCNDVLVAGAAAQIAFQLFADGVVGEIVALAMDDVDRGHDHAGRAEAALQAVMLAEGFLHRMQRRAVGGKPLDRLHLVAVGHHRKRGAGLHRLAVEMHDAGAALRGVAADMGAGQPQIFAQELHQQGTGIDIGVDGVAVHDHGNFGHQHSLDLRRRLIGRTVV